MGVGGGKKKRGGKEGGMNESFGLRYILSLWFPFFKISHFLVNLIKSYHELSICKGKHIKN